MLQVQRERKLFGWYKANILQTAAKYNRPRDVVLSVYKNDGVFGLYKVRF